MSLRSYFVDETKGRGVVKMQKGKAAIQGDLARLEKWADRILKVLTKSKFQAFHLGGNSPAAVQAGGQLSRKMLCSKRFGGPGEQQVEHKQQRALAAKASDRVLGCVSECSQQAQGSDPPHLQQLLDCI